MQPYIVFSLGTSERFCVPLLDVVEITTVPDIAALPHQSERLAGIAMFRDNVIAVGRFDKMVGFTHDRCPEPNNMIVFHAKNGTELVGLLVQNVHDIKHISEHEKTSPNFYSAYVEFVVHDNSLLIQNINVSKLLDGLQQTVS